MADDCSEPGQQPAQAGTEGILVLVFLAVEVLTAPEAANWAVNPLVSQAGGGDLAEPMPATGVVLSLLALAVLLQALQSPSRFPNSVSVGYFSASCQVCSSPHPQPDSQLQLSLCQ